jgi:hypothetical protein
VAAEAPPSALVFSSNKWTNSRRRIDIGLNLSYIV